MGRIVIGLFLFIVFGCSSQKKCERAAKLCPTHEQIVTKDSTVYNYKDSFRIVIKEKDSVVVRDSFYAEHEMPCQEGLTSKIVRGGDVFTVSVKDGKVKLAVSLKGTESRYQSTIKEKDRVISELKQDISLKKESKTITVVSVVTHVPWWAKVLSVLGGISLIWFVIKLKL